MFGLSPFELILFGIVAILLFGSKLPEVARSLGQSYNQFRRGLSDLQGQFKISEFTNPTPSTTTKLEDYDEPEYSKPVAPKFTPPPAKATGEE
ncbi:twin arginine translocase protein A [Rosistilla ulvae]|uniref:Twin arginine translocase protein A n=1 Tax=Rosistilla ulvae TaxID=1930277 RepID=A0A517LVE9_9BACT|nr:twin-arginine translocase TatA/TatE family subunit [Rosistilla ulvae]QDS86590.1 twin arginine translocase protein A [Rosistilla ulvae]